jgi:hypothetical protein
MHGTYNVKLYLYIFNWTTHTVTKLKTHF